MPLPGPFFYLLTEDNRTNQLATTSPSWGRPLTGVPAEGSFQMTSWTTYQHVVVRRLASHPMRTLDAHSATCCVLASPVGSPAEPSLECTPRRGGNIAIADRLAALGARLCPGRPTIVIDGPDSDGTKDAVCHQLWSARSCARGVRDPLVRVTGDAPGIQSEVASRMQRGLCRRLPPTPYISHARSPLAAQAVRISGGRPRPLRVAYAAASWGHIDAEAHGFVAWRKALRNACKGANKIDPALCKWVWISMSGNGAEQAVQQYAGADFCLQPPGDTLPRPGVMDAISVGCVPVLFHPLQGTLWPKHWNATGSSLLFDWTSGAPRPMVREHAAYAERAQAVLHALGHISTDELRQLREGVASAAAAMLYASDARHEGRDAIDVLVEQMRAMRLEPSAAEQSAYESQLAHRTQLLEAQRRYDEARTSLRRAKRAKGKGRGRMRRRASG